MRKWRMAMTRKSGKRFVTAERGQDREYTSMMALLKWIGDNLDELTITMEDIVEGYWPWNHTALNNEMHNHGCA